MATAAPKKLGDVSPVSKNWNRNNVKLLEACEWTSDAESKTKTKTSARDEREMTTETSVQVSALDHLQKKKKKKKINIKYFSNKKF